MPVQTIDDQFTLHRFCCSPWAALILLLIPLALYFPSLGYGLLFLDDRIYFVSNPLTSRGRPEGLIGVWTGLHYGWTPITHISVWFDQWLRSTCGIEGWWTARLQSLFWFSLGTLGVRSIVHKVTGNPVTGFAVALIYALHPLCASTVMWLALRRQALCLCFVFWSISVFLSAMSTTGRRQAALLTLAGALCAMACMSRFLGVVAWPIAVLLASAVTTIPWWRPLIPSFALAVPALAYVAISFKWLDPASVSEHRLGDNLLGSCWLQGEIFARYLVHIFWPWQLSSYYGVTEEASWRQAVAWWAVISAVAGIVWCHPNRRLALRLVLAAVAMVSPVSNVAVNQVFAMADHYIAPALPFLVLLLIGSCDRLWPRLTNPRWPQVALGLVCLICVATAWPRHWQFAHDRAFVNQAIARSPESAVWWGHLANLSAHGNTPDDELLTRFAARQGIGKNDMARMPEEIRYIVVLQACLDLVAEGKAENAHLMLSRQASFLGRQTFIIRAIIHAQNNEHELALRLLARLQKQTDRELARLADPYLSSADLPTVPPLTDERQGIFGVLNFLDPQSDATVGAQRVLYLQAEICHRIGRDDMAAQRLMALLAINGHMVYGWELLAEILRAKGDPRAPAAATAAAQIRRQLSQ